MIAAFMQLWRQATAPHPGRHVRKHEGLPGRVRAEWGIGI